MMHLIGPICIQWIVWSLYCRNIWFVLCIQWIVWSLYCRNIWFVLYASSGLCEACIVETIYYLHASWIYAGYTVYGLKYLTDIKCPFNASSMWILNKYSRVSVCFLQCNIHQHDFHIRNIVFV
jgi:hypothetical protein